MGNEEGMSWETTDVLSADTTDVLSADTTDVLSADTTDVLSTDTTPCWRPGICLWNASVRDWEDGFRHGVLLYPIGPFGF